MKEELRISAVIYALEGVAEAFEKLEAVYSKIHTEELMKPANERDEELLAELDEKYKEATRNVRTYWKRYNEEIDKAGLPLD